MVLIMDAIKNFFYGAIAGVLALVGFYLKGKSSGKSEKESEINEKIIEDIGKIKHTTTSDNLKRVRSKYTKR